MVGSRTIDLSVLIVMNCEVPMDSGKLRKSSWLSSDLEPFNQIELVYMRRRAQRAECLCGAFNEVLFELVPANASDDLVPPVHIRSTRWQSDELFEMRRITLLQSKFGVLLGYRPMIQQGHGASRRKYHASFRAADYDGSLDQALIQAKAWRDQMEARLGIKPGSLRSKSSERPFAGVSLIVSNNPGARSYWGSNRVTGKSTLRVYIGQRSYAEAYHDLIRQVAERDGIPLPEELPTPPPPRLDQYKRMVKAGFTDIPLPAAKRRSRSVK